MNKNRINRRESFAALIGGCAILTLMAVAQWLDAESARREAEAMRAKAIAAGFEEGLSRVRCAGGLRYDSITGEFVDVVRKP